MRVGTLVTIVLMLPAMVFLMLRLFWVYGFPLVMKK
jgi:hypothetical protein